MEDDEVENKSIIMDYTFIYWDDIPPNRGDKGA